MWVNCQKIPGEGITRTRNPFGNKKQEEEIVIKVVQYDERSNKDAKR